MLRDKMIDRWVEELDKEIIDLQALREEVTGEQANEAVRTLTDPDYRAEVGNIGTEIPIVSASSSCVIFFFFFFDLIPSPMFPTSAR